MFQENAIFEEILSLVLLAVFVVICMVIPGAIADREEHESRSEKVKDKEVI